MITQGSNCEIAHIAISDIRVTEYQERYAEKLAHYIRLMLQNPTAAPGFIIVKKSVGSPSTYEVLDGHHRFVAHIMTGRTTALCIVVEEPNDTRTDDQRDLEELRAKLSAPPRTDANVSSEGDLREEARGWSTQFAKRLTKHWRVTETRYLVRNIDPDLGQLLDRLL